MCKMPKTKPTRMQSQKIGRKPKAADRSPAIAARLYGTSVGREDFLFQLN